MLRQLGIELDFLDSPVSIGLGGDVVKLSSKDSLQEYQGLLDLHFSDLKKDIAGIVGEIGKVMGYMEVLYGIDKPLFLDVMAHPKYVFGTILPWMLKYLRKMPKIARLGLPVEDYLAAFSGKRALIDIVAQHFFKRTPTFFALSYFSLYLDYRYPRGGTGSLPGKLAEFIRARGGEILPGVEAADAKALYRRLDLGSMGEGRAARRIRARAGVLEGKSGGDSVFSVYLSLDLAPGYFARIASAHFFYTPSTAGLSSLGPRPPASDKAAMLAWLTRFFELNTFEISCPALRDPSLAPPGKTGLIVSTLMDHSLAKAVDESGWYEEFRAACSKSVVSTLDASIFPGFAAVLGAFDSTPLTLEKATGNSEGAITGWAFTNDPVPAVSSMPRVARSVLTPIPDVLQAGQWSYSPSGLPISRSRTLSAGASSIVRWKYPPETPVSSGEAAR